MGHGKVIVTVLVVSTVALTVCAWFANAEKLVMLDCDFIKARLCRASSQMKAIEWMISQQGLQVLKHSDTVTFATMSVCIGTKSYFECLYDPSIGNCRLSFKAMEDMGGIEDAVSYVCQPQLFPVHINYLKRMWEVIKKHESTCREMDRQTLEDKLRHGQLKELCGVAGNYIKCLTNAMVMNCEDNVVDFMYTIKEKAIGDLSLDDTEYQIFYEIVVEMLAEEPQTEQLLVKLLQILMLVADMLQIAYFP